MAGGERRKEEEEGWRYDGVFLYLGPAAGGFVLFDSSYNWYISCVGFYKG